MIDKTKLDKSWSGLPWESYGTFESHCPLCGHSHTLLTLKTKIYCPYSSVELSGWSQRVYNTLCHNFDQALFLLSDLGKYEYEKLKKALPLMKGTSKKQSTNTGDGPNSIEDYKKLEGKLRKRIAELEEQQKMYIQQIEDNERIYRKEKQLRKKNDKLIKELMEKHEQINEKVREINEADEKQAQQQALPGPSYWRRMFQEMPDYD